MNHRYNSIDMIRGIAIVLVVIGHAIDILQIRNIITSQVWQIVYNGIYAIHMPMFFVASGVLEGKKHKITGLKENILKDVISLYVPYVIFNFLYWLQRIVVSELLNYQMVEGVEKGWQQILPLFYIGKGPSWFLLALLLVKVIFDIIKYWLSDIWAGVLFGGIFFLCVCGDMNTLLFQWLSYGVFFVVGYFFARYYAVFEKKQGLVIGVCMIILFYGIKSLNEDGLVLWNKFVVGVSVTLLLLMHFSKNEEYTKICFLGKYSIVVLLVHWMIQGAMEILIFSIIKIKGECLGIFLLSVSQIILAIGIINLFQKIKIFRWIEYIFYPMKLWNKIND